MKLTLVLRDKKKALKVSTKTIERFIERIQTDTKDRAVSRRRKQLKKLDYIGSYDKQNPPRLVYPSAEFEKDANDNLRMKTFNGVVALTVGGLESPADIEAVKHAARILHYTLAAFTGASEEEVIILVKIAAQDDTAPTEEEADALCEKGHRLASALYQAILPKTVRREKASVSSCFLMPLDEQPYFNPKAMALPVSEKPEAWEQSRDLADSRNSTDSLDEEMDEDAMAVSQETQRLMDFLNARYEFRYNTIMGYTEHRSRDDSHLEAAWKPVDDRSLKGLTMKVRLSGIDARENDVRRYVQSDMITAYNPIGEFLWEQYYKWDGKDHIRQLARTVPTSNPHWEDWFYTWFLGMVRQWQETNLAKYGNQAVPLLINLDEFNQISPRIQQGFLKNLITLSSVKIKRPYGRHVEDFPRRASFIATTNQADVLADPSGSRRFLGVELTGPIDVSTPPNHEQLYAQAMHALSQHEPCYFGPEATQLIMESNRQFNVKSAAEQFFLDYFEPAAEGQDGEWISASAIYNTLKDKVGVSLLRPSSLSGFGRTLSNIPNLKKRQTKHNTEYFVVRKKHGL